MIFLFCLISWSRFCSCEIRSLGGTHKVTQMEEFCFAYLKWEMFIPCVIAELPRRPMATEPDWHEKRSTSHFSARHVKHTLHISLDCFSILPRQLPLQINKYVLNTVTRVFKINMLSLLIAEICHDTYLSGSGVTGFRIWLQHHLLGIELLISPDPSWHLFLLQLK